MTPPAGTLQWATYLDMQEIIEYLQLQVALQFPSELSVAEQRKLQRYIDSACTQAQNIANRPLAPTQFRERHDGWAGDTIQLYYSPFLELKSCREFQSSGGFVELPESTPENPVEGIQIDYATSTVSRTFAGYSWPRPFFPGRRNVEITYVAGYNPVPPDVWEATAELVAWKWRNTQQATRGWMANGQEFDQQAEAGDGMWAGMPNRIRETFENLRLPSIG